jgi:ribosomal protein S18 acetylase RimI-like enzyme
MTDINDINLSVRPARESDLSFLWQLRQLTMKQHVENSYGWIEEDQKSYAREHLRYAKIFSCNGLDIGVIKVVEYENELFLSQLQVHPEWCGKGIGHSLLAALVERAKKENKIIRLHVIKVNPAVKLYREFGFVVTHEMEHQFEMTRTA